MATLEELQARIRENIKSAAIDFANDYGPLPAANAGDERARDELASRLVDALYSRGLRITSSKP